MKRSFLDYLRLYVSIPAADAQLIEAACTERSVAEGEFLFAGTAVCKELFFICSGVVRILSSNTEGIDVTHYFLKENQFCTILNSFLNRVPADERIQAACGVEVVAITRTSLDKLYKDLPYLQKLIGDITQQGLLDKIELRNSYLGLDSTRRYRLFLLRQPDIALRVPLANVASYLGITPQSLSRIRRKVR